MIQDAITHWNGLVAVNDLSFQSAETISGEIVYRTLQYSMTNWVFIWSFSDAEDHKYDSRTNRKGCESNGLFYVNQVPNEITTLRRCVFLKAVTPNHALVYFAMGYVLSYPEWYHQGECNPVGINQGDGSKLMNWKLLLPEGSYAALFT